MSFAELSKSRSVSSTDLDLAIRFIGLSKWYGPTKVLSAIDLSLEKGQVHGIVGANGAGKSTLVGIASGQVEPSAGEILVFGRPLRFGSPRASRASGVATVFQELAIVPHLSALANVFLGDEYTRGGFLRHQDMKSRYRDLCRDFRVDIEPSSLASSLSVADLQLIEIMRAVQQNAQILILDEPTAALSVTERDLLFNLVRQLIAEGRTVLIISHNLGDLLSNTDTISVMRNGVLIDTRPTVKWSNDSLIQAMMGDVTPVKSTIAKKARGSVLIEVKNVSLPGALEGVNLSVCEGEIVGLAGLVGSGRTSLLRSLAGVETTARGELLLRGRVRPWPKSVRRALKDYGIALLPEERKTQGLLLHLDVGDNVTVANLLGVKRGPFINRKLQRNVATRLLESLRFNRTVGKYRVEELSGGNQQKVVLAKWLHRDPDILLADEPTRGVDVAAKQEVLEALRSFASSGKAVIVTSSELEEILEVSDRLYVLFQGHVVAEVDLHDSDPSVQDVLTLCFGVTS